MLDLTLLALVKLAKNCEELRQTPQFGKDLPQSVSADCVKGFGLVNERSKQAHVLLPTFLLDLSEHKYHVGSAPVWSESTLAFREIFFCNGWDEPVQKHPGQYFASDGQ